MIYCHPKVAFGFRFANALHAQNDRLNNACLEARGAWIPPGSAAETAFVISFVRKNSLMIAGDPSACLLGQMMCHTVVSWSIPAAVPI
jgi:hypothetical protein